jgi:hypothetical protein
MDDLKIEKAVFVADNEAVPVDVISMGVITEFKAPVSLITAKEMALAFLEGITPVKIKLTHIQTCSERGLVTCRYEIQSS